MQYGKIPPMDSNLSMQTKCNMAKYQEVKNTKLKYETELEKKIIPLKTPLQQARRRNSQSKNFWFTLYTFQSFTNKATSLTK